MNWWSESKRAWQPVSEMILPHARNAAKKLAEGRYVEEDGMPPSAETATALAEALSARIADLEAELDAANGDSGA